VAPRYLGLFSALRAYHRTFTVATGLEAYQSANQFLYERSYLPVRKVAVMGKPTMSVRT
jgi:hypothetical protein